MPLQKSTGRVASMTRTAPVGPITRQPSARRTRRAREGVGIPAHPHHHAVDLQHDARLLAPPPASARLRACRRLVAVQRFGPGRHDDGRKERPLGRAGRPAARQPTPAKQLLGCQAVATRDAADRVPVHITFLNNRSLLGRGETAAPPPPVNTSKRCGPSDTCLSLGIGHGSKPPSASIIDRRQTLERWARTTLKAERRR